MPEAILTDLDWVKDIHEKANRWKKIYEEAIKNDPNREKEETRLIVARYNGCADGIHTTIGAMCRHLKRD